jgi:predicted metalloprotease
MKWRGRAKSSNVDDRRGGGVSLGKVGAPLSFGGLILVIILMLLNGDSPALLQNIQDQGGAAIKQSRGAAQAGEDELGQFVQVVLKDTENVWDKLFREQLGKTYQHPTLVIFTSQVRSACGLANSGMGPFYCPVDDKVYIDLGFYSDLKNKFNAPGDAAMGYVVAHEVAHHVQNQLGYLDYVNSFRGKVREVEQNSLSVRLELQADYLAGVFMHHAEKDYQILEDGDIEEALRCANQIGDDTIQKRSRGYVVTDSFTHGTSEQRVKYFKSGLRIGSLVDLDRFFKSNTL